MYDVFQVKLSELQPSQLYINSKKLAAVMIDSEGGTCIIEPLPVKKPGNRLVLTDAHTRAVAAHLAGLDEVSARTNFDKKETTSDKIQEILNVDPDKD
jgi:hypothetical protein